MKTKKTPKSAIRTLQTLAATTALAMAALPGWAGNFTGLTSNATSASGSVTDNGQSGTFTFTQNSSSGYAGTNFTGDAGGLQVQNINNNTVGNDEFNYTFTVFPPTGYEAIITIRQANTNETTGNSEAADRSVSWAGGGTATVSDTSGETRTDSNFTSTDFPDPNYRADNSTCTPPAAGVNQILGLATGDTITSGTSFATYAIDNSRAEWTITLPTGVTSVDIDNVTQALGQAPGIPFASPDCLVENNGAESFSEWVGVDVAFVAIPLDAVDDTPAAVDSVAGGTIPNVVANDSFDGVTGPAITTDVTLTPTGPGLGVTSTPPAAGSIVMNANGTITVAPGTTPGTYTYTYQIADADNAANFDTAEVTVLVGAGPIDAIDDAPTAVDGATGATISNVVANDTLNGVTDPDIGTDVTLDGAGFAQDGITTLGLDTPPSAGGITLSPNGDVVVDPGTTPGTYIYTYEICDVSSPTNCATAEVTIVVEGDDIDAVDDTPAPVTSASGGTLPNVVANDSFNGSTNPAIGTDVTLAGTGTAQDGVTNLGLVTAPAAGGITLNPNGEITVDPGTTPGTYVYVYEICDAAVPTNCATAQATIVVEGTPIDAVDDTPTAVDSTVGATIPNVVANDSFDGATDPAIGADVTLAGSGTAQDGVTTLGLDTPPAAGSIVLNANGDVTVAPGTTPGVYVYTYEICEAGVPTNCDTATVTIAVLGSGTSLLAEIEEELTDILEEDLANTLTMQSRQIGGYSADARDRLARRSNAQCLAAVNIASKDIRFDTDKAVIRPESHRVLDEVAQILGSCAGTPFEIAGHTDSDASDAYNIDLSQRRVIAVRRALAERGVDVTGYVARGYGESQPIASNATEAGKQQNRRVEFRSLENDVAHQTYGNCESTSIFNRELDAQADQDGSNVDGAFLSDRHSCVTDRREVFEGSLSYTDTDQGQEQTAINLSYRREQYRGGDSVLGFFVGVYGSQTDVSSASTGDITGLGLNAGLYGANRFRDNMFLDYYIGAATGRHSFDLGFDRAIGSIAASGNYQYLAGFAGAAISGEYKMGETVLTPRGGFDYVFAPGADVDVLSQLGAFSEVGSLDLDAISGGRLFAELNTDRLIRDGSANLSINPRISCYQSLGSLDGVCGFGGSIGIASVDDDDQNRSYAFELDGEWGNDFFLGTASASLSRGMGPGLFSGDVSMNTQERVSVGASYGIDF